MISVALAFRKITGSWIAFCYFPVTLCPLKICGPEAKINPFRVSQLEIIASFIIIIVISFSFSCYFFFFLNEESPSIPFGTFPLANSSRVSLSYSTALLDIYVSFPQEYCSSVLGIYYIQFLSVFVLSTFTTVLCQKN